MDGGGGGGGKGRDEGKGAGKGEGDEREEGKGKEANRESVGFKPAREPDTFVAMEEVEATYKRATAGARMLEMKSSGSMTRRWRRDGGAMDERRTSEGRASEKMQNERGQCWLHLKKEKYEGIMISLLALFCALMARRATSSSISYKWAYDVFLSFHGEDTRLGFISYPYEALCQRGIHAFIDDEGIKTGEEITPALFKAIQESTIAIVVFSENYANSTFCLEELVKIMECFKEEGQLIYPIFYYVDPSELRRLRGSYEEALARLEEGFKDNKQKVQKWRLALSQAAELKGYHFKPKYIFLPFPPHSFAIVS
ncbi:disease resistance protein RUN1-like [Prosopis cineraria]|uniref:disease resistance protein RUN1-like n=1 Tax=Prosopis cineraria TaxID=364024 RepID=UPI00240FDDCF|nr:disease resistance protein RUN1-like [Prosopis cineraria]